MARGASYHIKGKIYRACVQSALTYGPETWAMKKANLQSLERTEQMMVRWMCRVSLRIGNAVWIYKYSLLGVQSFDEVVRRGRLRWFGHAELRVRMIECRPVEMWWWQGWDVRLEGARLGINVWRMILLFYYYSVSLTCIWRRLVCTLNGQCSGICGGASFWEEHLTLAKCGKIDVFKINDDDDDDGIKNRFLNHMRITLNLISLRSCVGSWRINHENLIGWAASDLQNHSLVILKCCYLYSSIL